MPKQPKQPKKKDKFKDLPSNFKSAVEDMSTDEIKKRISDVAILEVVERQLLKDDADVEEARGELAGLLAPYRDNLKSYRLQIEYCREVLDLKNGGATTARAEEQREQNRDAEIQSGGETNTPDEITRVK